jgi:hypothetical protein
MSKKGKSAAKMAGGIFCKAFLFAILAIAAATLLPAPASALYEARAFCPGDACVAGGDVTFGLKIFQLNLSVRYTTISMVDVADNYVVAARNNTDLVVRPGSNETYTLSGILPAARFNGSIQVVPCFGFYVLDQDGNSVGDEARACGNLPLSLRVYNSSELQCLATEECEGGFSCNAGMCVKIQCGSCEHAENHSCIKYECCSPSECQDGYTCTGNACEELSCGPDEKISGHECVKLGCGEDEYASDGKCEKLQCLDDEMAQDHACVKLECRESQKAEGHACVDLQCRGDEVAKSHECQQLKCGLFGTAKNGECSFDIRLAIKLVIGIIVIGGVGGYLYSKYRQQHG